MIGTISLFNFSSWWRFISLVLTFVFLITNNIQQLFISYWYLYIHSCDMAFQVFNQFSHSVMSDSLQPHGLQHTCVTIFHVLHIFKIGLWNFCYRFLGFFKNIFWILLSSNIQTYVFYISFPTSWICFSLFEKEMFSVGEEKFFCFKEVICVNLLY